MANKVEAKKEKDTTKNKKETLKTTTKKSETNKIVTKAFKDKEVVEEKSKIDIVDEKEILGKTAVEEVTRKQEIIKIEDIQKTMKNKKKVPKEEIEKINKILFRNIILAVCIITYFIFLNLGHINIKPDVYQTDLKVFSMCTLLIAIVLLEMAYKKDSGEFALYGVEMIVLSLITVSLIYINLMFSTRYVYIISAVSYIFAIYYLVKSMIIYIRKRKKYFVSGMKEIMNKDE